MERRLSAAPKAPAKAPQPQAQPQPRKVSALARLKSLTEAAKVDALGKDARSVMLHMAAYMDEGGWCYPSADRIAEDSGYSRRSVLSALGALRRAGVVLSLPPDAWRLAVGARAKVPKYLPMHLLWPVAPHADRFAALWALDGHPRPDMRSIEARCAGPYLLRDPAGSADEWAGPYTRAAVEHFARTLSYAPEWILRTEDHPGAPLDRWVWFAAMLPRVPVRHRG